ncbi:MAG: hypothetical protein JSS30_07440 [Verrucomicrobia bacterium]|nr:hypothetical protein [Verrucomicrobiota bacterium]
MSTLVGQLGSYAASAVGTMVSYFAWGTFKVIGLAGTGLQAGGELAAEYVPQGLSWCGDKLNTTISHLAPKAFDGLKYVGSGLYSGAKQYAPSVLKAGKVLVLDVPVAAVSLGLNVAKTAITVRTVAGAGFLVCGHKVLYGRTPKQRLFAIVGTAICAHFLIK